MATHSIAPTDAGTWWTTAFDDGPPMAAANAFYTTETGWSLTGVRVYFSAALIAAGGTITAFVHGDVAPGIVDVSSQLGTVVVPAPGAPGWAEATLPAPVALSAGTRVWVGYHSSTGAYQAHSLGGAGEQVALGAADGSNLFLGTASAGPDYSEFQYSPAAPPYIDTPVSATHAWGVDVIASDNQGEPVDDQIYASTPLRFFGVGYDQFDPLPAVNPVVRHFLLKRGYAVAQAGVTASRALSYGGADYAQGASIAALPPAVIRRLLRVRHAA